jgi:hypothetical protein
MFSILVVILTASRDNFIKRHQEATFGLEMIISFTVSGCIIRSVYSGCSYSADPVFAGWCGPTGYGPLYYTMALLSQIFAICSVVMVALITRRIRQVRPCT